MLVLGDGNLSFSHSLSKLEGCQLIATTFLTEDELFDFYGHDVKKTLQTLEENPNVSLHHGVDATNIPTDILDGKKADIAVFNFPCVQAPGDDSVKESQLSEIESNKKMLDEMFVRMKTLQISEVHISHKCKGTFNTWNVPERCQNSGMKFLYAMAFDKELYPDFSNKKLYNSQAACHDAKTFVFSDNQKNGDYKYEQESIQALEKLLVVTKETTAKK